MVRDCKKIHRRKRKEVRREIGTGITVLMIFGAFLFGFIMRFTYTDITAQEDYLDSVMIAAMSDNLSKIAFETMDEEMENVPIIIKVQVTKDVEHLFKVSRQKVRVEEICQNHSDESLSVGEEIYLYSAHWCMIIHSKEEAYIQRGFTNIPVVGEEYLVFLSQSVDDLYQNEFQVFELYDEFLIAPVIALGKSENNVEDALPSGIAISGTTYVNYSEVCENEFFGMTQEALDRWKEWKERILDSYGRTY